MKISRLFIKLYLYFLAVLLIILLVMPLIILHSIGRSSGMRSSPFDFLPPWPPLGMRGGPPRHHGPPGGQDRSPLPQENQGDKKRADRLPPHLALIERLILVTEEVRNSSPDPGLLKARLAALAKRSECEIALYDAKGLPLLWTGRHAPLDEQTRDGIKEKGWQLSDLGPARGFRLILPIDAEGSPYAYYSILNESNRFGGGQFDHSALLRDIIIKLLITCLILSLLIYPLALHLTRPLESITRKAISFSQGDFTRVDEGPPLGGGDEIGRLDKAFNHMAKKLTAMIEGKKELISDISHELGSPLSRMQVAVEIVEKQMESGEMPSGKTIRLVAKNIEEMSKIVKELLDLSRANRTYVLNRERIDLEQLVADLLREHQIVMSRNNLRSEMRTEGDVSGVLLDGSLIRKVLQNLLSNALDYSPENGVLEISLKGEGEHFTFSIKDMGPGISRENAEKIFEPLFREDPSRARKTGGTGLGLAIAKKIVALHGGRIWVENPGEKGALISFRI